MDKLLIKYTKTGKTLVHYKRAIENHMLCGEAFSFLDTHKPTTEWVNCPACIQITGYKKKVLRKYNRLIKQIKQSDKIPSINLHTLDSECYNKIKKTPKNEF